MIGFDYGTSNCSVATMVDGQPHIIPLVNHDNQQWLLFALSVWFFLLENDSSMKIQPIFALHAHYPFW